MQTHLSDNLRDSALGKEAEAVLRACVHCGLCNATCPTYQLLGDERDGPRGRIYLLKQVLEGEQPTARTQLHLDRCLGCLSCETTCPSGVDYSRLLDIGRVLVEEQVPRPWIERLQRRVLLEILPYPSRFAPLVKLAGWLRNLAPVAIRKKIPLPEPASSWPPLRHGRKMLALEGCVQSNLAPSNNAASARVLDRLGISLVRVPAAGCCGALSYHLSAREEALDFMRRNIDAWIPYLDQGAEAIVMTASGCGLMVKEYSHALRHDAAYADKASRVSAMALDLSEALARADLRPLRISGRGRIAFQSPCSLQHGQQLAGVVEAILARLGFELAPVAGPHLCCGSAGTYSILQPALSRELRSRKLDALGSGNPSVIATANIGCLAHLQAASDTPVRHWIELIDEALA